MRCQLVAAARNLLREIRSSLNRLADHKARHLDPVFVEEV